jgi:hypothetical protein
LGDKGLSNGEPISIFRVSESGSAKEEPTNAKRSEQLFHDSGGLRPETFNPDTAKKAIRIIALEFDFDGPSPSELDRACQTGCGFSVKFPDRCSDLNTSLRIRLIAFPV